MRDNVLLQVRTHIKVGGKILEQELASPARPAVSAIIAAASNVTRMFYVSVGLDQDIKTGGADTWCRKAIY